MLKNNRVNMVLALIVAIVLWAYVLGELNPSSNDVVRNVPINFLNEEKLEESGLTILSNGASTVNISISGKRTSVTKATAGDFNVTADLDGLKKGENTVRLNVTGPSDVKIEGMNIEKMVVVIDEKASQEKPVEALVTGQQNEEREVSVTQISKETTVVSGPKTSVDRVEKMVAYLNAADIDNKARTFNAELVPVDSRGEKVEGVYAEGSGKVSVTAVMLGKKTVKLEVPIANQNSDGVDREVTMPKTVVIKGSDEALAEVNVVICETLDLAGIDKSMTLKVEPLLPEGIELADEAKDIYVQVKVKEMITRTFEFAAQNITLDGKNDSLSYKTADVKIKVTVTGRESLMKNITEADIRLSARVSGLANGIHSVTLEAVCGKDVFGIETDPKTVEITIEKKE